MLPIVVGANQPPSRFYRGGPQIAAFRKTQPSGDRVPEDWVGSTTTLAGEQSLGLSTLEGGQLLRDAIAADPEWWLGSRHVAEFGDDVMLLVKLLDAGQRLPIHAHPDGAFARTHFGLAHGKAEAWFILEPGEIHLGLTRDVTHEELLDLVKNQDVEAMLALLHRLRVEPGDAVFVPAGYLHAIGSNVFLAEVQEPEDLSILLEWRDFELDGERDGHLGLGFEAAISAVHRSASTALDIEGLVTRGRIGNVLPDEAAPFFRLSHHLIESREEFEPGFAIVIVLDGHLRLGGLSGPDEVDVGRGQTLVFPASAGGIVATGSGELLLCRPPAATQ